jgi:hypothetical protein
VADTKKWIENFDDWVEDSVMVEEHNINGKILVRSFFMPSLSLSFSLSLSLSFLWRQNNNKKKKKKKKSQA